MRPGNPQYKAILDHLSEGVYVVAPDRRILYWNPAAEQMTGYEAKQVVGQCCANNILRHVDGTGHELCTRGCSVEATLRDGQEREADVYLHHKNGHRVPVHAKVAPIRNSGRQVVAAVQIFRDNSQELALFRRLTELERSALLDALTEVPNRRFLEQHLDRCFDERKRYGWTFGVVFLDIDRFKDVNDTYGHEAGDKALKMVSRTLASNLRSSDVLGRWGGEEFLILCPNIDAHYLRTLADRLRVLVEASNISFGPHTLQVTVSVGATVPRPRETARGLLRRVDRLMYQSKRAGRNHSTFSH
jgi:diguanylate cyclase (GGDEF)-like protein/PAS domain S-box-containing protein